MKTTMVIPSYWTRERALGTKEGDTVYDHPTPLDEQGTLKRTLESIDVLEDRDFSLVVIAVAVAEDMAKKVEDKVSGIVSSVSLDIPVYVFGHSHLKRIHEAFKQSNNERFCRLLNLAGYSSIRNLCLFLPHLMDSDIAVLIDDDEVFEDPGFIGKAREFIGKTINGEFVGAVAGYYLQPDGDWLVECKETAWAKYWDKTDRMNEAFKKIIGEGPRLKETPFVFGGNMIVHRDVFTRIPFDPNVTRGEDIDFLINMKMFGYKFFLDNKLSIKHLPPPKSHPVWKQLREDIRRFAFERAKLRDQNTAPKKMAHVSAEELMPYPGAFLTDDLEEKIAGASSILADHYRFEGKEEDAKEALKNIDIAVESALSKNALEKLIDTQKLWEDIMKFSSTETRKHLTETFTCIKKEEMATL